MPAKAKTSSRLNAHTRYLQIALNSTLTDAHSIISSLPVSDRILIEAGTPLIKRYGAEGIARIVHWYNWYMQKTALSSHASVNKKSITFSEAVYQGLEYLRKNDSSFGRSTGYLSVGKNTSRAEVPFPYVVADLKTMDRGMTEVQIAAQAGASAAVALGTAPIETLDSFIESCELLGIDAMIDMMNVGFPLGVLHKLKKLPQVVILHRGVDEEQFNKEKQIPLHEIRRIKGSYNVLISIAGGDTLREVQRAVFNDADIVVVWKSFFQSSAQTAELAKQFLKEIK